MGNYICSKPSVKKRTEWGVTGGTDGLQYAISSMKGWRVKMEDTYIALPSLHSSDGDGLEETSLFAIFDGHGGSFAAKQVRDHFVEVLQSQPDFISYIELPNQMERDDLDVGVEMLKRALRNAFFGMDAKLLSTGTMSGGSWGDQSGCTAMVLVITPQFIVCANAGDSRAAMGVTEACRHQLKRQRHEFVNGGSHLVNADGFCDDTVSINCEKDCDCMCTSNDNSTVNRNKICCLQLSMEHKPTKKHEEERIKKAGGSVDGKRIDDDLAVSRGLGDFRYKNNMDLRPEEQIVTALPDIVVKQRDVDKDKFLILGCDGIWSVRGRYDPVSTVAEILQGGISSLPDICEKVLDICLEKGSKDNMTILIIMMSQEINKFFEDIEGSPMHESPLGDNFEDQSEAFDFECFACDSEEM